MKLIFVRHGQTVSNSEFRYQGHQDSKLNQLGLLQAARTAAFLKNQKIDAAYSSDLSRASETAKIIAEPHGLTAVQDPRLRECSFGRWEGLTAVEIQQRYPELFENYKRDSIAFRAPGGERLESVYDRTVAAVYDMLERHPEQTVLVVTHGGPAHAFLCHALETDLTMFRRIRVSNGGITIVSSLPGRAWFVEAVNYTLHLKDLQPHASMDESASDSPKYWTGASAQPSESGGGPEQKSSDSSA